MSKQTALHEGNDSDPVKSCADAEVVGSGRDDSRYPGSGTFEDPYLVNWELGDPENPFNWPKSRKWLITTQLGLSTWTASFGSSAYTGGLASTEADLHMSREVAILGITLFVLGFGFGPLLFAPLGEAKLFLCQMYGRRIVFLTTFSAFTLFHLGGSLAHNVQTLLATRALAGIFGSAPFSNAGGALSDIWIARERGIASSIYATAPFLGPVIGPIVSGWIEETRLGWRFNFWIMFMASALCLILGFFVTPETYAPVLLRRRAHRLQRQSDNQTIYISKYDTDRSTTFGAKMRQNLSRPFLFLATEPIVALIAVYISIAYATLYGYFSAYPIVFQEQRHFSPGQGGLAFLGIGVGSTLGMALAPLQNLLYWRAMDRSPTGRAPPEERLYMPMVGGICLPIGLFWFAWTSRPPVPWIVPILAGIPFGTGVALIMQGLTQYLMEAYSIYCASALAATIVLRSICGAVFPLFMPIVYTNLGDEWAGSLFGFMALACTPVPFLFYKYGPWIRGKSPWAVQQS
ncbi:MFS general substrate transporter, partial [Amylocystis lapponica]